MYSIIYDNLCQSRKTKNTEYKKGSGIHKHHIIPRHMGGLDDENNFTYLSIREHIIAHFLLWKIHGNPQDLRSMHILGARISPQQRKIIGEFCRDNKIGIHNSEYDDQKEIWRNKGIETQKLDYENNGTKNFYYWSTPEGRKERAVMGGKKGCRNNPSWIENSGGFKDAEKAKKAGIKSGKLPVTNGTVTKKFHSEQERLDFLSENPEWKSGSHWKRSKKVLSF